MATRRSKTLSKTDLMASRNAAIVRAFTLPHVSNEDIAHIFDLKLRQVQNLRVKWRTTGDLTPVPKPGRPTSATTIRARSTIRRRVAQNPVQTVAQLSRDTGVSRTTGGRVIAALGLRSRARERRQKLTPQDKQQRKEKAGHLFSRLQDGLDPEIFLDEAKMELNPYLNSTKDRVIEAVADDAGDAGVNEKKKPNFSPVWHGPPSSWPPSEHSSTKMGSLDTDPMY